MSNVAYSTAFAPSRPALPIGEATMIPAMENAARYAGYVYGCVARYLQAPILEIGSGYGTYTGFLLRHGTVVSCDIDGDCLDAVRHRYLHTSLRTSFVDLNDTATIDRLATHGARSIFSTNVLEHVEDDIAAFASLRRTVQPGGSMALLVPAHESLFGYLDSSAGHFRRYTRRTVTQRLEVAGWSVEKTFYLNAIGGAGWWFNHQFLPAKSLDAPLINTQMKIYDRLLVPLARLTDPLFSRLFGLSVIAIARRVDDDVQTSSRCA